MIWAVNSEILKLILLIQPAENMKNTQLQVISYSFKINFKRNQWKLLLEWIISKVQIGMWKIGFQHLEMGLEKKFKHFVHRPTN